MTPEAGLFLKTAETHLQKAQIMLGVGLNADAGRRAYLAGFHAAQAYLFDVTTKTFKTHHGVQVEFIGSLKTIRALRPRIAHF